MDKRALIFLLLAIFIFGCKKEEAGEEFWGEEEYYEEEEEAFGGEFPTLEEDSQFEGTIETRGDFTIKGRMTGGSVIADGIIVIEETAFVQCDSICGLDVIVRGYVKGKIKADGKIQVDTTGTVVGATSCKDLIVNGGSIVDGSSETSGFKK